MSKYFSGGEGDNVAAVGLQELIDEVARLRNELAVASSDYSASDKALEEAEIAVRALEKINAGKREIWNAANRALALPNRQLESLLQILRQAGAKK